MTSMSTYFDPCFSSGSETRQNEISSDVMCLCFSDVAAGNKAADSGKGKHSKRADGTTSYSKQSSRINKTASVGKSAHATPGLTRLSTYQAAGSCVPQQETVFCVPQQAAVFCVAQQAAGSCVPQQETVFCVPQQAAVFCVPKQAAMLHSRQQEAVFCVPQQAAGSCVLCSTAGNRKLCSVFHSRQQEAVFCVPQQATGSCVLCSTAGSRKLCSVFHSRQQEAVFCVPQQATGSCVLCSTSGNRKLCSVFHSRQQEAVFCVPQQATGSCVLCSTAGNRKLCPTSSRRITHSAPLDQWIYRQPDNGTCTSLPSVRGAEKLTGLAGSQPVIHRPNGSLGDLLRSAAFITNTGVCI